MKESEAHLRILSTKTIPDLMDTLGMGKFTTTGGHEVSIREFVRGSIPKARTDEAITWLNENGHERLVKQQCVIDFGREDEAWAQKFPTGLRHAHSTPERRMEAGRSPADAASVGKRTTGERHRYTDGVVWDLPPAYVKSGYAEITLA